MAARFFVNGTVNNNWSNTANWSDTSGGVTGSTVPGTSDVVTLDENSPNCVIDGVTGLTINTFTVTSGYTKQLTVNNILIIASTGTLTLGVNMLPLLGTGGFAASGIGTKLFTLNGKAVPNFYTSSVSAIVSLQDDLYINGSLICTAGTIGGAGKKIYVKGSMTLLGAVSSGFGITIPVILLNPVKMIVNPSQVTVSNIPTLAGYNQVHTSK